MNAIADVESNSSDDRDNKLNDKSVIISDDFKPKSYAQQVRKQMTMLDYCKSAKLKAAESVDIENNLQIDSTTSPPAVEATSFLPTIVHKTGHEAESHNVGNDLDKSDNKSISSMTADQARNKIDKNLQIDSSPSPPITEVTSLQNGNENQSNSSISSLTAVKSRKRTRETSITPPLEESTKLRKKRRSDQMIALQPKKRTRENTVTPPLQKKHQSHQNSMPNKRKSVNKSSRLSVSKKSSKTNGSTNDLQEAEDSYRVEKVVGIDAIDNTPHFHIKWKGYAASQNTWEPLSNLSNCTGLLNKFLASEFDANKTAIDKILFDLNAANANSLTDEEALRKLEDFDSMSMLTLLVLLATLKESDDCDDESYNLIHEKLRDTNAIPLFSFWCRRKEQLKHLEEWQNDINKSDKSSQITVENNVDFEKSPSTFEYVNDCVAGEGVVIPDDPLIGCDCKNGCSLKSNCCGKQLGSAYAYTSARAIRLPQGNAVFECNKLCKCGPDCTNRVVQQGRKHSLTIFKTSNGRGWGVRTDRVISKGQYICEYVGEIITNKEAEARGHIYDAEKRTYLFDLDCNSIVENKENLYTIDACKMGNVSRMINHSCDPNIGTWSVWINCLDLDIPKICFYALRRIEAGEELSFDYLSFSVHDVDIKVDDDQSLANIKTNFECKCNSGKCRKYIFDPSLLNPVEK